MYYLLNKESIIMANRTWQELAAKAKEIAKKIISGEETNSKGERLLHIVYRFDTFASDSLNQNFADSGSIASIHTYQGGNQVITTKHSDGSEGTFNSNGEINPTDAPMDMEVNDYINKNLDESNMKTNKRNVVRLTESQLKQMITECVKNVLNEISYKTYANAASAAEDRESIFKKSPTYPYPNIPEGPKNPEFYKNYKKNAELAYRQSKQPEKFKKAAYAALSHEIGGEDDFWKYITSRINNNDVGDDLAEKIKQYQEGEKYIKNNGTKWSVRNQKD